MTKKVLISEQDINTLFLCEEGNEFLQADPWAFICAMHVYALAWFRNQTEVKDEKSTD